MAVDNALLRDKFEGCLLAGAAGDALGYKIEFWPENEIFQTFGGEGIATLGDACSAYDHCAHFSDDTQMTLFTANGLTFGMERTGHAPETRDIWLAYREWLATQGDDSRMDDPLHPKMWLTSRPSLIALRAPGNTCLSAIRTSDWGGTIERPVNHSKGCGGVMRVAPAGLLAAVRDDVDGLRMAAEAAALTHGHPGGWLPAGMLAEIVAQLVPVQLSGLTTSARAVLEETISRAADATVQRFAGYREAMELRDLVDHAMRLARHAYPTRADDVERIHQLGEGWVGDEALAIAVYAALAHADDFAAALRCAVNHKGDSDSTGAVCGNILGALLGRSAIEQAFDLELLEERDLIASLADDLLAHGQTPDAPGEKNEPQDAPRFVNPPQVNDLSQMPRPRNDEGMPYTALTKRALEVSFAAHCNQRDKSGVPYVYHPFHLADQMRTEECACVALLHDVVEDGGFTLEDLTRMGFGEVVVGSVAAMTHRPDVPYMDYVLALRDNPVAREVKIADLRHNANLSRLDDVTVRDRRRRLRYLMALALLDDTHDVYDPLADPPEWRKLVPLDDAGLRELTIAYAPDGLVRRLEIVAKDEGGTRVAFGAEGATALRQAIDPMRSLPEGLADTLGRGGLYAVTSLLDKLGIHYLRG